MATPLNKSVHRVVELNGEKYLASLEPETEQHAASYTLRKMRTSKVTRTPIKELLDGEKAPPETSAVSRPTHARVMSSATTYSASEIKSKLAGSDMDYKLKVEVLRAVDDLLEVDALLDSEPRTLTL